MALKNGVSFVEFSGALQEAYVDVASQQLKTAGHAVTADGIFVITSIDQMKVEDMLRAADGPAAVDFAAQAQNPLPRILNGWHTDTRYTGPYGVLRDLEFARELHALPVSEGPSFSELAQEYCPGVSPRALLDELMRTGCVIEVGKGFFRATSRSYVPDPLSDESIRLVAQIVHNLCETLEVNLRPDSRGGNGLVQRTIYTRTGVSQEALKRFATYVRTRGQLFADEVDDWFVSNQERAGSQGEYKTGVGFYHYVVNDDDERDLTQGLPTEGDK